MSRPLRLGFAGTPEFAATILEHLIAADQPPELVFTQPDRPTGRGRKLKPSPVKTLAQARGLSIQDPARLKGISLAGYDLDLLVVAAYGLILPVRILAEPRLGCLNVHASLLPRWRGAAPVERAIMAGDAETGVCLMQMDAGLDTGPVYACERLAIGAAETGGQLEERLARAGATLLLEILPRLDAMTPRPQPEAGVTYAHKLTAADSVPDWQGDAAGLARRIRALADRQPLAAYIADDAGLARIRLLGAEPVTEEAAGTMASVAPSPGTIVASARSGIEIACGSGRLRVTRLQLNRGKGTPMPAEAAINGYPGLLAVGQALLPTPPDHA